MTLGRPTTFTPDLGALICSLIAEGQSVRKVCLLPDMPHLSTVMLWVLKGDSGDELYKTFSDQYARAIDIRADYWAEQIVDISDDNSEDELFTEDGKRVQNGEFIQRSKLKIETRKWLMGKLKRKKYGESVVTESTNTNLNLNADVQLSEADIAILKRFEFDV